ncbi:hypothetical protein [Actinomadura sp. DC4]|uniref:hypothetical protein n=1 Tax=Actinomadura sp. DC4 TaxID=3055069 RepID=UPI0025B25442|nr:hypothetical protein [Actinomadura sp. DC4]MDN3359234.1 hypothetical protein [Actinomadura sp. DC4]
MRSRRDTTGISRLVTVVGFSAAVVAGSAGAAVAAPVPRPVAPKPVAQRHVKAGHHHPRLHTIVRCQNDDTEQIDEFGDEGEEPRHTLTPAGAPGCSRAALDIARILAGDRARPRAARPVR